MRHKTSFFIPAAFYLWRLILKLELRSRWNLDLAIPLCLIILAEMLIFFGNMKAAMVVHAINLILMILSAIYVRNRIYPIIMLLPLFRLLNVATPVFFHLTLYSYCVVYAPLFIPIYFILKKGLLTHSEAGITFKGFWLFLPLALSLGIAIGWGEYNILHPEMLVPDLSAKSILILSLVMIIFVGIVEEFIFRSALQTVMIERLDSVVGLLITCVIFGLMQGGYHLPQEMLYATFSGCVFGLLFRMTKSLPIISVAHGVTNVSLFIIAPAYSDLLIYLIAIPGLIYVLCAAFMGKTTKDGISQSK